MAIAAAWVTSAAAGVKIAAAWVTSAAAGVTTAAAWVTSAAAGVNEWALRGGHVVPAAVADGDVCITFREIWCTTKVLHSR